MKSIIKILVSVIIFSFVFSSFCFAESRFSEIENKAVPSVMDFKPIYEEFNENNEEFYVIDLDGAYTFPSLIKDPLINELKIDIENKNALGSDITKENYPELFGSFDIEIVNCKDGSKFAAIYEKKVVSNTNGINMPILLFILLALIVFMIIIFRLFTLTKKNKYSKGDNLNSEILKEDNSELEHLRKEFNKVIKQNEDLKKDQTSIIKEKDTLLSEVKRMKQKEETLNNNLKDKEKEFKEEKRNLLNKKEFEINEEAKKILNDKIKEADIEFNKIKNQYLSDIEVISKERKSIKQKEDEIEARNQKLIEQENEFFKTKELFSNRIKEADIEFIEIKNQYLSDIEIINKEREALKERENEIEARNQKLIEQENKFFEIMENKKDRRFIEEYEDKIFSKISNEISKEICYRLENAEKLYANSGIKEIYSSEVNAYTSLVEYLVIESSPLNIKNDKSIHGVGKRISKLKSDHGITKEVRNSFSLFYDDAEKKDFFIKRNGSAHAERLSKNSLEKTRSFLLFDDIVYYKNIKESRLDWLLRMVELNESGMNKSNEVYSKYKGEISGDIYDRLKRSEIYFDDADINCICSSEDCTYITLVEYILKIIMPSNIKKKKLSIKEIIKVLKGDTSIPKKERKAFEMFYNDFDKNDLLGIIEKSTKDKKISKESLGKIREFLFEEEINYYDNKTETRFDWLLKMVELNK